MVIVSTEDLVWTVMLAVSVTSLRQSDTVSGCLYSAAYSTDKTEPTSDAAGSSTLQKTTAVAGEGMEDKLMVCRVE